MAATYPKNGQSTKEEQSAGTKGLKSEILQNGQTADIFIAPPSRLYSRDYSKIDPDGDQGDDTLSPFLGNPLRW